MFYEGDPLTISATFTLEGGKTSDNIGDKKETINNLLTDSAKQWRTQDRFIQGESFWQGGDRLSDVCTGKVRWQWFTKYNL